MTHICTNDGVDIHYVEYGSGRPVIFVPGWSMSSLWFEPHAKALAPRYRSLLVDPRGQGDSREAKWGYRLTRMAKDFRELIEELDLHDVTLVAWSMGCASVFAYWDLFGGDRLESIVLTSFNPVMSRREAWEWGNEKGAIDLVASVRDYGTFVREFMPKMFSRVTPAAEELEWMVESTLKSSPRAMELILWDQYAQDWRDIIPNISVPVLVVEGGKDSTTPWESGEYVALSVPNGRFELFAESGHVPFWEERDRFIQLLDEFLGQ